MPPTNLAPKYSLSRYWRFVFVPLVIILIFIAWYVIFTLSPAQLAIGPLPSIDSVASIAAPAATTLGVGVVAKPLV